MGDRLKTQLRRGGERVSERGSDVIFAGVTRREDLAGLRALKELLAPDGALWAIREKGNQVASESDVRAAAHAAGLVDVKVVRVSDAKTGDKLVIPLAARKR